MLKNSEKTMEKIVALCKGRGFVYAGQRDLRRACLIPGITARLALNLKIM